MKTNWSSDFLHAETGSRAKKRVVLRYEFFCSNFKVEKTVFEQKLASSLVVFVFRQSAGYVNIAARLRGWLLLEGFVLPIFSEYVVWFLLVCLFVFSLFFILSTDVSARRFLIVFTSLFEIFVDVGSFGSVSSYLVFLQFKEFEIYRGAVFF